MIWKLITSIPGRIRLLFFTKQRTLELVSERADFPPEYSEITYRQLNPDLSSFDSQELKKHYYNFGIYEGRRSYPFTNRNEFAAWFSKHSKILEISPFTAPFAEGLNVEYADVLSRDELVIRAKSQGLDAQAVPKINYVIEPNLLSKSIQKTFDLVVSSHVVEHQPNLLVHLREVGKLLNPGGNYVVVIPDKRYCFDHFMAESNVAEVVWADSENRSVHTLRSVIEHEALTTHNFPSRHWEKDHGSNKPDNSKIQEAINKFVKSKGEYIDVHAWYFTPDSFRDILTSTFELGLQPFEIKHLYPTFRNNLEFYAVLSMPS